MLTDHVESLAKEFNLSKAQIQATLQLLQEGNTVPFIARYRKEITGELDEVQIRDIHERAIYLQELSSRKTQVIASIDEQGKLTSELKEQILACDGKTALEDLYLPYKPKRRTRAMIAKERGLQPLADLILAQGAEIPCLDAYLTEEVSSKEIALKGACDIIAETVAENAEINGFVRNLFARVGVVISKKRKSFTEKVSKFEDYYDFSQSVATIPSHRYLAIRRGEVENVLDFEIWVEPEAAINEISKRFSLKPSSPLAKWLLEAIEDGYKRLIAPRVETDLRVELKMRSDEAAVKIFAENLRSLLMAAPFGNKSMLAIDPGFRTGCKCVSLDANGKYIESITIFPTIGEKGKKEAAITLAAFIKKHKPFSCAIGNGTAGRETEQFMRELIKAEKFDLMVIAVNESGASIYSASDVAREEFPNLDLTIRGAISIGRRLQDPLAELVKIEPKSIGVGQYQHDVYQPMLQQKLSDVVEDCVNRVGVDVNTASKELLSYVSGIGPSCAKKIIDYRNTHGSFSSRDEFLQVPSFGGKTYEQAAGFLRIRDAKNPLDSSAVHPERYELIEKMASDLNCNTKDLVGNASKVKQLNKALYLDVGSLTLSDIIDELLKPGRDPRATFDAPKFRDDVMKPEDLKVGMLLEGAVTNVCAFGVFVDIGVHQDGLVHIAELADHFVKNPADVVKPGDKIKVRVLAVDIERKRISLSAKSKGNFLQNENKPKQTFATSPFSSL